MNKPFETTDKLKMPAGLGTCGVLLSFAAICILSLGTNISAGEPSALTNNDAMMSAIQTNAAPEAEIPDSMAALDDRHKLSVGDRLNFQVLEDNDDPKQLFVADSGDLNVPYLGFVPVLGKTCKQLAVELKKGLEEKFYYHATVIVSVDSVSGVQGKAYASGALRLPGPLEISSNEVFTVGKAVICAGGFTDFADKHNVKVTRRSSMGGTNQTFTVDAGQILEKGRTDLDMVLQPGDMIFVPERIIRF